MTATRPNFFAVIIAAYWDLGRVLKTLWAPALMALALFIAAQFSAILCARLFAQTYLAKMLLNKAIELGSLVLIVPFLVALQRLVLLGEATQTYEIVTAAPRVRTFAAWLLLLGLVAYIPSLLAIVTESTAPLYIIGSVGRSPPTSVMPELLMIALVATVFVMVTCLMIMLPAVAVESRGATLANTFADMRRNEAYIAGTTIVGLVPVFLAFAAVFLLARHSLPVRAAGLAAVLLLKITVFATIMFAAALAAQLYLALGNRLNQPEPA